ncbi:PREDICTED: uncharacterized protein LOC104612648 isoform X3 [Nelumbo nucifera]|uniref:Uncharacterized protein LOC104612648 isoform X3 n=1 Tax=Nelumbo nucifera TaxID=4432 RepID=A0A1U8BM96_NELNU|nr:PREDICTED: uncharacterized protein LOC104612648 isoform X3 [Nelumbo nucifera]
MACGCGGECSIFLNTSSPLLSHRSLPTKRLKDRATQSVVMGITRCRVQVPFSFPGITRSNKIEAIQLPKAEVSGSNSNVKKANLFARRKESVKLPNYDDGCGGNLYPISAFLNHPSGVETILNKDALQSLQSLDSNTYRCTLQKIQLLNFEVAPVLDLRVTTTNEDCIVEMLSCKFEGSEAMECQNDHFSASMVNHMKWDASTSEPSLDVDVKLSITLEIYTRPFTLLPVSAVENPGNLIMQRLVDKLVSLLVERLLQDYDKWVQEQLEISP